MTKIHLFTFGVPGLLGPAITSVIAEHRISDATFTPLSGNLVLMTWEEPEKVDLSVKGLHNRVSDDIKKEDQVQELLNTGSALDRVTEVFKNISEVRGSAASGPASMEPEWILPSAIKSIKDYQTAGNFGSLANAAAYLIRVLDVELSQHKPNDT